MGSLGCGWHVKDSYRLPPRTNNHLAPLHCEHLLPSTKPVPAQDEHFSQSLSPVALWFIPLHCLLLLTMRRQGVFARAMLYPTAPQSVQRVTGGNWLGFWLGSMEQS